MSREKYIRTIGLEVQAQIKTESKAFSGAFTTYGSKPNTKINLIS